MKKMKFVLLIAATASLGYFTSCNKDTTAPGPTVTFDNNVNSASAVNGSYTINGTAKASGKLKEIQFYTVTTVNGSTSENEISGSALSSFSNDTVQHFSLTVSNITTTTTIKVLVTDKNSLTGSSTFTINVGSTVEVLNFWTGSLAAQLWAQSSSSGSAYATSTNTVYTSSTGKTNSSVVDFIYYYSTTSYAEIISPDYASQPGVYQSYVTNWGTKNATKFGATLIPVADFDAIVKTDDSKVVSAASSLTLDKIPNLAANTVFAFQTAAGKKGLVKVTNVDLGSGDGTDGSVTIEVKVQK